MGRAWRFAPVMGLAVLVGACLPTQTPDTIAVLGDSITAQWSRTGGQAELPEGAFLYGDPAATLSQPGFIGEKAPNLVLQDQSRAAKADIVVLRYGTNDANAPEGWNAADEAVWAESIGPNYVHPDSCLVIVLPYVAGHVPHRAEVDEARASLQALAATRPETFVVDWADYVGDNLSDDGVHLDSIPTGDWLFGQLTPEAKAAFTASMDAALAHCDG